MRARLLLTTALLLLLAAAPSHAATNPVFDDETAADIQAALDEATAVQGVCYGVRLEVDDGETGTFTGSFEVLSAATGPACRGSVVLQASLTYTSEFSELEDSAFWSVVSDLPGAPTPTDLRRLGLSAGALLDDGKSEQTLLNAVLALPALTAERVPGVVPLVLVEATAAPPAQAAPTDTPGSDRVRTHLTSLALLGLLLVGAVVVALYAAFGRRNLVDDRWLDPDVQARRWQQHYPPSNVHPTDPETP
ncbi:MAG: hypothetical protein Q8R60_04455 [Mycobacteriales bacterium]|nr:hypothetical protein [Mycobacteriales bacterium]